MTENTKILRQFEYYLEDLCCHDCLYSVQKSSLSSNGSTEQVCLVYVDSRKPPRSIPGLGIPTCLHASSANVI